MILQPLHASRIALNPWPKDDERRDDLPALDIGRADHRALPHLSVRQQCRFDLGPGNVVTGGDDHIVCACGKMKATVLVLEIRIASQIPAMVHVGLLPRVGDPALRDTFDLAAMKDGTILVTHDPGGPGTRIDPADGSVLGMWGDESIGWSGEPTVDAAGNVYLFQYVPGAMRMFDATGHPLGARDYTDDTSIAHD